MKDENLSGLANRIRQELTELEYVLARLSEGWVRHVVRNVYTYRFDPAKVEKLFGLRLIYSPN